jgi:hypothetical protein
MITFSRAVAITPNNSADLATPVKAIITGTSGTLKVDMTGVGAGVTIQVIAGQQYQISVKKVYATGTSATGIIGFY